MKTHFSWRNVLKLYGQVWFWSVFSGVCAIMLGTHDISIINLVKIVLPFTFNRYWYFSSYILIFLFYPFFNRLISTLNQKQHIYICCLSVTLFSAYYTLTHAEWIIGTNRLFIFISMYFVGAYIRKYGIFLRRIKCVLIASSLFLIEVGSLVCMKFVSAEVKMDNLITYFVWGTERIFPCMLGIVLFIIFEKIEINNKMVKIIVSYFSPALFGVYLFHVGDLNIWLFQIIFDDSKTYGNCFQLFFQMLFAMITIFLAGTLIDKIRVLLLEKVLMKLLKKPIERLDNLTSFLSL